MPRKLLVTAMAALIVAGLAVLVTSGSSHREAPRISQDPAVDATDLYAFVDPSDPYKVNLIVNYYPFQEPNGGPNFFRFADDALYFIHIDNDGDARADVSYQFHFHTRVRDPDTFLYNTGPITSLDDEDWNIRQDYDVLRITHREGGQDSFESLGQGLLTPPVNIGPVSTPDYEALAEEAVHDLGDGTRVFAGQRDDPFFADLGALFDLLTIREPPGNAGGGVDGLAGFNVQTIALQVPVEHLTSGDEEVIGIWTTSRRPMTRVLQHDGSDPETDDEHVQVSRLANPLVNEVVIPLRLKDRFNASQPRDDAQFLEFVTDPEVARLFNAIYGDVLEEVPESERDDLVAVFLTGIDGLNRPEDVTPSELLRLNTKTEPTDEPERLAAIAGDLAGFPNGRRLEDDVVDIALRAAACGYGDILEEVLGLCNLSPNNELGDGVDENDVPFLSRFPYVGTPHAGFEHEHHTSSTTTALTVGSGLMAGGLVLGGLALVMRRRRNPIG